jgi:hypothetical protein
MLLGTWFVHLVLMALHAVHLAMMHPDLSGGPGMLLRIHRSGAPGIVGLAACLIAASWISRDLRRGSPPASWPTILPRALSLGAALAIAAYLLAETVPMVDGWLAQGFRMAIGPVEGLILVAGLAGLGAGVVARALAPAPIAEPGEARPRRVPRPVRLLARTVLGCLLLGVIVVAGLHIVPEWVEWVPRPEGTWKTVADTLPGAGQFATGYAMPQILYLAPALAWLVIQVPRLVSRHDPSRVAPFDAVFAHGPTSMRFRAYWPALTLLCLAALPAFFFTSLFVYQELHVFLDSWRGTPLRPM